MSKFKKINSSKTPYIIYAMHRIFFRITNGAWNNILSKVISILRPRYKSVDSSNGVLHQEIQKINLKFIVSEIEEKGYFVFESRLIDNKVEDIVSFAKSTKGRELLNNKQSIRYSKKLSYYNKNIESPKFQYDSSTLALNKNLESLLFDQSLMLIAQEYLKCKPILDLVTMWWSKPGDASYLNAAAQKFHFDMDRIKFLKFFFYLTDVDENRGPHVFVEGTHKKIHKNFLKAGRFQDDQVEKVYGDKIKVLTGKKGTILAVDTRGLHKGLELVNKDRLLFQIQFSNFLFGQSYPKIELNSSKVSSQTIKKYPKTYKPIFLD